MGIDSGLLAAMRGVQEDLLPSTCTIKEASESSDGIGQVVEVWTAIDGGTDVACRLALRRADERIAGEKVTAIGDWVLTVAHDQAITTAHRVVVGSQTFDVVGVNTGESWETATRVDLVEVV